MESTYPIIVKYTPAVLRAQCMMLGKTIEEIRFGTLKRIECELGNLLENALNDLHSEDRFALEHLHQGVRLAIGEE